ncbi:MAG: hypothetical protein QW160_03605 [Candidatus Bathyarchaeia archaeon]
MELFHVTLNLIALAVNACLAYFACRMLAVFRGGMMSKPWRFVYIGVLALAAGSSTFSLKYLLNIGGFWPHALGGLMMLLGGVLALIGIYIEYKNWTIPKQKLSTQNFKS